MHRWAQMVRDVTSVADKFVSQLTRTLKYSLGSNLIFTQSLRALENRRHPRMDPTFLEDEVKRQKINKHLSLFQGDRRSDVRTRNGEWKKSKDPTGDQPAPVTTRYLVRC